tara:strand:- start:418 stop:1770 length:1353 start_codon:yes stop_codon:yes gene_type:complete
MAYQVHFGRLSFTSPSQLTISAAPDGKSFSVTGQFGGVENTLEHLKYLRDELSSLAYCEEIIPFKYDGDSTLNSYVRINSATVTTSRYSIAGFAYSVDMEMIGREGDVMFESRLTGALLENNHSITSTTEQFHSPPGNHYAFLNPSASTSSVRTAADLTTTNATDTCSLYIKQGGSLRNNNSVYSVDIDDYYKGACRIIWGTHSEKTNGGVTSTADSVRHGKHAGVWTVGEKLVIENGIIKMELGTSSTQAKFKTYIWDETAYATEQEWAFSHDTPTGSDHLGDEFLGWRRVQILTNKPEIVVVRCTTYKGTHRNQRLVVDFTLRRGSHFVSMIANQYTSGTKLNISLASAPSTNASSSNIASGYLVDGTSSPEDNNSWILGSPHQLVTTSTIVNRGMIQKSGSGSLFSAMIGYILRDGTTGNPLGHNDADSVFKQYIDNVNENQRIIKA